MPPDPRYKVIETGLHGGQWTIFDTFHGPPSASHLSTTDKFLAERVCKLLNNDWECACGGM